MGVRNEFRKLGARSEGRLGNDIVRSVGECLKINLSWLTLNFSVSNTAEHSINFCLPAWQRWAIVSPHTLCSWAVQSTETGHGSVCVLWSGGGGWVMTQLIIAPLAICGLIYTGKWEGVRKKKKSEAVWERTRQKLHNIQGQWVC